MVSPLILLSLTSPALVVDPIQSHSIETVKLKAADMDRQFVIHTPKKLGENPPVVLAFHGHGGNPNQFGRKFDITTLWPEAVVVYGKGETGVAGITDKEGKFPGWQKGIGELDDRDLKYVDEIIKWLTDKKLYSSERTYVTGHSNGGQFTWILAGARNDKFAGFAAMCAPGGAYMRSTPQKPYMQVAGKQDELVKFSGVTLFWNAMKGQFMEKGESVTHADGSVWHPSQYPLVEYFYDGGHSLDEGARPAVVNFMKFLYESQKH